jgi:hypothetical protein
VESACDLYSGQVFKGKVQSVWRGNGEGQMLPGGDLPKFDPSPSKTPRGSLPSRSFWMTRIGGSFR